MDLCKTDKNGINTVCPFSLTLAQEICRAKPINLVTLVQDIHANKDVIVGQDIYRKIVSNLDGGCGVIYDATSLQTE